MSIFDAYLMVDWSANNSPKKGPDSIWYCLWIVDNGRLTVHEPENPCTRRQAIEEIKTILVELSGRGLVILIGFDFPYSYPSGFAAALQLLGDSPWKAVWDEIYDRIRDDNSNRNNRFDVASDLNRRLTGGYGPFWGCSRSKQTPYLSSGTRNGRILPSELAEYRITERWIGGSKPVWKLLYPGSAGSQTLVGIPHIRSLRYDPALAALSLVWPFETGLRTLERPRNEKWRILHAEIYPSICQIQVTEGETKDRIQVETMASLFARLDRDGELAGFFAGPEDLSEDERRRVELEEGWILGVL